MGYWERRDEERPIEYRRINWLGVAAVLAFAVAVYGPAVWLLLR